MAKGKYEEWLAAEGLILLEGSARDGLTDMRQGLTLSEMVLQLHNGGASNKMSVVERIFLTPQVV